MAEATTAVELDPADYHAPECESLMGPPGPFPCNCDFPARLTALLARSAPVVTHDHGTRTGWFADPSDEDDRVEGAPWQPFLQTSGCCFPLPVWFETKDACDDFIRSSILGRGHLDDVPC